MNEDMTHPIDAEVKSDLEESIYQFVVQAEEITAIENDDQRREAMDLWKKAKPILERIEEKHGPGVKAAHDAHKRMVASRDADKKTIEGAKKKLERVVADYDRERERERKRIQAEKEAAALKAEEDRMLAEAAAAEAAGDRQEADRILEEPVSIPPVAVPPKPRREAGDKVFRTHYTFEITNINLLPRHYMIPDFKAIGAVVRAQGEEAEKTIPGIKVKKGMV